jgi:hypothetical protein
MKRIDIEKREIDFDEYVKRDALNTDVTRMIKEDCIIYVDGEPALVYKVLPKKELKHIRWAVKNLKYLSGERTLGLKTESKVFGYSPRLAVRHDFCRLSQMGNDDRKQHKVITDFGKRLSEIYKDTMPDHFFNHENVVFDKVLPEWRIEGTPFTSGIVNKNSRLKYHFDAGNFKGLLSNMVVLKRDVDGGHLVIPEIDVALEVPDGALVIFNGQKLLHGVSEINYRNEMGYRYSVVFYSLEQMWNCDPLDEEIARIRNVKTEREKKRLDPEHIAQLSKAYDRK